MDFQEIIYLLSKKRFLLIVVPIISAILAFSLRFLSDKIYVSEAQISTGLTMSNDYVGEDKSITPFQTALSFENLIENMESKMVVNRLGFKLLYRDLSSEAPFRQPEFEDSDITYPKADTLDIVLAELRTSIDNFTLINRTNELGKYIYELLEKFEYDEQELLTNVEIKRVGNTDFINVRFSSEVPLLSAYAVNLWADNFLEYYNFQKTNRLNESLAVLSQILNDKQSRLDNGIEKLNRYKSRFAFSSGNSEVDPLNEYEKLIREKEGNLRSLNYRLQNIREKIAETDKTSSFKNRKKIVGLKNSLDQVSSRLMVEPKNKQLKDSLEYLRNELQSLMYLNTSSSVDKKNLDDLFINENELKVEYEIALGELQNLGRQFENEKGSVLNSATAKSGLENLETEVQQLRSEFISAQDKYNQARSQLIIGSSNLRLSYYGDTPEEAQSRKTIIFTVLGFVVGLVMTLFALLFLEFIDTRISNPLKFTRVIGVEPSGCIENQKNSALNLDKLLVGDFKDVNTESANMFVQTLRKLRFELQNLSGNTFLFTSFRPSAGKTFMLTSLAYSLTLIQKRVLIIDTNFRNNTLSKGLSEKNNNEQIEGLSALFAKTENQQKLIDADMNSLMSNRVISVTKNPLVHLIKCNNYQRTPEEIFSHINFVKFVEGLKKHYDYIFIEGAALCDYSDSKELAKYAQYIIPVISTEDEFNINDKNELKFFELNDSKMSIKILNKVSTEDVI